MPTEIIPQAAAGFDIIPWICVALLGGICIYLTYRLVTSAKPKSEFKDWEACKELNKQEGPRSAGRWVFLIVLGIDGHIMSTERAERMEGFLVRRNGQKIWETTPGTIWNFAGVPTAVVWGDRYQAVNCEVAEALTKLPLEADNQDKKERWGKLRKAFAKREEKTEEGPTTEGWSKFYKEGGATVAAPWHVVDFEKMERFFAPTTPSAFYNIANRVFHGAETKSKGILDWILKHPIVLLIGVLAIFVVVVILPGLS